MKTRAINLSGGTLVFAGILIALSMPFHPDDTLPGSFLQFAWTPVHILLGIATIAVLAGLGGLYTIMSPKLSVFGRVSFGLTLLGTVLLTGVMLFFEATLLPALSSDPVYKPLLSDNGPIMNGPLGFLILLAMLIASAGYVLLAVYLAVSKTITYGNAVLFIGVPLAAFAPPIPYVLEIAGGVMLGIALIWLGVSIRRGRAHQTLEETVRLQDECMSHAASRA
jgi:hypothetical protein